MGIAKFTINLCSKWIIPDATAVNLARVEAMMVQTVYLKREMKPKRLMVSREQKIQTKVS